MSTQHTARPPHRDTHHQLPRTDAVAHPAHLVLRSLRPAARWVIRSRQAVRMHGLEHIPASGPVIFASNHVGAADGPLLAIFPPRVVHALTKVEMFHGALGWLLVAAGQVPLDRFGPDPRAMKACLRVLRDGGAIGIFPEGRRSDGELRRFHMGAAYLGLVTGAPIVPVFQFGTRAPGGHINSLPPRREGVDLAFGPAYVFEATPWPRTREQVAQSAALLRGHLRAHLAAASLSTGRQLPGPVPAHEREPDPATGVNEQGAP